MSTSQIKYIYIVWDACYNKPIQAVFSTEDKANAYINKYNKGKKLEDYRVQVAPTKHELDPVVDK